MAHLLADLANFTLGLIVGYIWRAALVLVLCVPVYGATPVQLMPADKLEAVKASLPKVASSELRAIFADPRTLWYTNEEIPPAYQFSETGSITGGRLGTNPNAFFLAVGKNISGGATESRKGDGFGGNLNIEFPWRTPGGLDNAERITTTVRFMHLPEAWPVVTYSDTRFMPNSSSGGRIVGGLRQGVLAWTFPSGTTFGEVLYQQRPDGAMLVFEIRTRTKNGSEWEIDVHRPFPRASDLTKALAERGRDDLAARVASSPVTMRELVDRSHPTQGAFAVSAGLTMLPSMPAELVNELLTTTEFKSGLGAAFKSEGDSHAFAPTANEFSIVPPNYQASFLGSDSQSCMTCHKHTLAHVNNFDLGRDWYGYGRGADGIFTFHPVDPRSISYSNGRIPVRLRAELVSAGIVETYDPSKHPSSVYLQTKGLMP